MNVKTLTQDNFEQVINNTKNPIIVDFYADWCVPCKMMEHVIEKVALESNGKYDVYKFNVDASPDIPQKLSIKSIPTVVSFKEGKVHKRSHGVQPPNKLVELIN